MISETVIFGIDPGKQGAICMIEHGDKITIEDMPKGVGYPEPATTVQLIKDLVWGRDSIFAIEMVFSMPGSGAKAMLNYGFGAGVVLGAAYMLDNVKMLRTIRPQVWQTDIWSVYGAHGEDTKQRTFQAMCRAWAGNPIIKELTTARGKLLDGRSDALGIATWIRDVERGSIK